MKVDDKWCFSNRENLDCLLWFDGMLTAHCSLLNLKASIVCLNMMQLLLDYGHYSLVTRLIVCPVFLTMKSEWDLIRHFSRLNFYARWVELERTCLFYARGSFLYICTFFCSSGSLIDVHIWELNQYDEVEVIYLCGWPSGATNNDDNQFHKAVPHGDYTRT